MIPISYNVRNLAVRKATTAATAIGLALVVFVFAAALMFSAGMRRSLGRSADPASAIVLRHGAASEANSAIEETKAALVLARPEVARTGRGDADGVREIVSVVRLAKIGSAGLSSVPVRGVPDNVLAFRRNVRMIEGREARPGTDEVVIGRGVRGRFEGLDLNGSFTWPMNRVAKVVGVFEADGSSYESEIWAGIDTVRTAFGLEGLVSSVRVRLTSPAQFESFKQNVESDKAVGLEAQMEGAYYEKLSGGMNRLIGVIAIVIAFAFSICAMLGATITLRTSIAHREREIGTLRALGFSRTSILTSFLLESIVLCLGGGAIGALASIAMGAVKLSLYNASAGFEMVFSFEPTPTIIVTALVLAGAMGLLGGFLPALRAARMSAVEAMRT